MMATIEQLLDEAIELEEESRLAALHNDLERRKFTIMLQNLAMETFVQELECLAIEIGSTPIRVDTGYVSCIPRLIFGDWYIEREPGYLIKSMDPIELEVDDPERWVVGYVSGEARAKYKDFRAALYHAHYGESPSFDRGES